MYLISIYFDDVTDLKIKSFMKQIAKRTGNTCMIEKNVPPHITVAAFHAASEEKAIEIFRNGLPTIGVGEVQWISVGSFLPHVIYLTPVLNEYLHELSVIYNKEIGKHENVQLDNRYQPFHWLPHTTLAKQLTKEQLQTAFEVMQSSFGPFSGTVVKIGLAKTNPHTDIEVWALKK